MKHWFVQTYGYRVRRDTAPRLIVEQFQSLLVGVLFYCSCILLHGGCSGLQFSACNVSYGILRLQDEAAAVMWYDEGSNRSAAVALLLAPLM